MTDNDPFEDESSVNLEKVTIWYRCKVCSSYLYSIPHLRIHVATKHNISSSVVEIPENLPPGAENGKIYYKYELNFNKAPPSYPYEKLDAWRKQQSDDVLSNPSSRNSCSEPKERNHIPPHSPSDSEGNYVRVKYLHELLEKSTPEEEDNINSTQQGNSRDTPSPPSVVSPPDSGIQLQDGGSEFQDDEGQQHQLPILAPVVGIDSLTTQVNAISSSSPSDASKQAISMLKSSNLSSNFQQPTKLQCPLCSKMFNNASSLNFHKKKFHQAMQNPEKDIILTFQRDTNGNFSSSTGSKNKSDSCNEKNPDENRKRTRQSSFYLDRTEHIPVSVPQAKTLKQVERSVTPTNLDSQSAISKRNPGPKSRAPRKEATVSDNESTGDKLTTSVSTRRSRIPSSESEDASVSDASEITPPAKKRLLRQKKKSSESDGLSTPEVISTRSRTRRASRDHFSVSESSASELGSSIHEENDEDESDIKESEEEMSDKSTTSEQESIEPPFLGSDDENGRKKKRKEAEKENASSDGSDSCSSEDLFVPIIKKKKYTKSNKNKSEKKKKSCESTKGSRAKGKGTPIRPAPSKPKEKDNIKRKQSAVTATTCSTCFLEFKNMQSYITHLYKAHPEKEEYYNCGFCQQRFSTKMNLQKFNDHVTKVHSKERNARDK